jgi:hypothetical protein
MAMSPVAVCNMALSMIGGKSIRTIDSNAVSNSEEMLCAALFWPTLKVALEAGGWRFATGLVDLGASIESDDPAFICKFVIPTTVITPLQVDDGSGEWAVEWSRQGGYIYTKDALSTVSLRAVLLSEDPGTWTPSFVRAVALLLASDLSEPVAEDVAKGERMYQKYKEQIDLASSLDGRQGSSLVMKGQTSSFRSRR